MAIIRWKTMYQVHLHRGLVQHPCHNRLWQMQKHQLHFLQQMDVRQGHTMPEYDVPTTIDAKYTRAECCASIQNRFCPNVQEQILCVHPLPL